MMNNMHNYTNSRNRTAGRSGSSRIGWFHLIAAAGAIILIAAFWKIILTLLILGAAIWLIWIFRDELAAFVRWSAHLIWDAGKWCWHQASSRINGSRNVRDFGETINHSRIRQPRR